MIQRVCVLHPNKGLMLGYGPLGFAWSHENPMGQFTAITFPSASYAVEKLVLYGKLPNVLRDAPVTIANIDMGATVAELRRAGLSDWVGPLERNFLCCVPSAGNA